MELEQFCWTWVHLCELFVSYCGTCWLPVPVERSQPTFYPPHQRKSWLPDDNNYPPCSSQCTAVCVYVRMSVYVTVCPCTIFVYLDSPRKLKLVFPEYISCILAHIKLVDPVDCTHQFLPANTSRLVGGFSRERFGAGISSQFANHIFRVLSSIETNTAP